MAPKNIKQNTGQPLNTNPSKHRAPLRGPGKTFQYNGHWIENPHKPVVLVFACGNRYLKTRDGQTKCLRCLSQGK